MPKIRMLKGTENNKVNSITIRIIIRIMIVLVMIIIIMIKIILAMIILKIIRLMIIITKER